MMSQNLHKNNDTAYLLSKLKEHHSKVDNILPITVFRNQLQLTITYILSWYVETLRSKSYNGFIRQIVCWMKLAKGIQAATFGEAHETLCLVSA